MFCPLLRRYNKSYTRAGTWKGLWWAGLTAIGILLYLVCDAPLVPLFELVHVVSRLPHLLSLQGPFVFVLFALATLWCFAQSSFWLLFFAAACQLSYWEYWSRHKHKNYEWHREKDWNGLNGQTPQTARTPSSDAEQERFTPIRRSVIQTNHEEVSISTHTNTVSTLEAKADTWIYKSSISALLPGKGMLLSQARGPSHIDVGYELNIGLVRVENQDSLSVTVLPELSLPCGLFIVADGVGGQANGKEASLLAVETMNAILLPVLRTGTVFSGEDYRKMLLGSLHQTNLALSQHNRGKQDKEQMNTTITVALLIGYTVYIANVGDSRTYVYSAKSGLERVTRDHSYVEHLVATKQIQADEVYTHPERNLIYRSLGNTANQTVDLFQRQLTDGDSLLLCSDGLWEMVRDPEIVQILRENTRALESAERLLQAALEKGGDDNIGLIVAHLI